MSSISRGGPKTAHGKKRSSRNALKHGLFSAEFVFSATEALKFDELRSNLSRELQPNTPSLEVVFEDILTSAWRMKLALRCEQIEVRRELEKAKEEKPKLSLAEKARLDFPYPLIASELKMRQKLLEELEKRIRQGGSLPEELVDSASQAFGSNFCKTLIDWAPVNVTLLRMMEVVLEKSKLFGVEPPVAPPTPDGERIYTQVERSVRRQMMLKLLDLEKQHLQLALDRVLNTDDAGIFVKEGIHRLDLFLRYLTTAKREFYRALKEYREAKKD